MHNVTGQAMNFIFIVAFLYLVGVKIALSNEFRSAAWGLVALGWTAWATNVFFLVIHLIEKGGMISISILCLGTLLQLIGNTKLLVDYRKLRRRKHDEFISKGRWK